MHTPGRAATIHCSESPASGATLEGSTRSAPFSLHARMAMTIQDWPARTSASITRSCTSFSCRRRSRGQTASPRITTDHFFRRTGIVRDAGGAFIILFAELSPVSVRPPALSIGLALSKPAPSTGSASTARAMRSCRLTAHSCRLRAHGTIRQVVRCSRRRSP